MFHDLGADGAGCEEWLYHHAVGIVADQFGGVYAYGADGAVFEATPVSALEPEWATEDSC